MENNIALKKEVKAHNYLLMVLAVFGIMICEEVVVVIQLAVAGKAFSFVFDWKAGWLFLVLHWCFTLLIWGIGIFLVIRWAKNKNVLTNILKSDSKWYDWAISVAGLIVIWLYKFIFESMTKPQFILEYKSFVKYFGNHALIISIFQNTYYLFEATLVLLMLSLTQAAGESHFRSKKIPWAGLIVAVTWGVGHFISHPDGTAQIAMLISIIFGAIFIIEKKSFFPLLLLIFGMFVI